MAIPSGLSAQIGVAEETVYGTAVTVARFYELLSEKIQLDVKRLESAGLRAGTRLQRSDRWVAAERSAAGEISMELASKGFGLWFKHALGGVSSTQPAAGPDPLVWLHTFTPGDLPVGLTVQVGRPDINGSVKAFTYTGCCIDEWTLECAVGELLKWTVTVMAQDETLATPLATANYPTNNKVLTYINGALTIAGTSACVKNAKISGSNGLVDDRYCLGSPVRKKPLENKFREYTGTLEAEFDDVVMYQRFVSGTEAQLIMDFQGDIISTTKKYFVKVTANVRFDGETPTVGGPEILTQPLNFKCVGNTDAQALTIEYQTTDTAP